MIMWLDHFLKGCWTTRPSIGYGRGCWDEKKNKPMEFTKDKYWFYACDYCRANQPSFKIRIIKEK